MIRALLQLLIGCFLLLLGSWPSPTPSLLFLPAHANYGARLISVPPHFLLRRMEGTVRRKGWMRKRSEAKRRVEGEQEREGRRVPGSRPTNRFSFAAVVVVVVVWPGLSAFLLYFFFADRFKRREWAEQQGKVANENGKKRGKKSDSWGRIQATRRGGREVKQKDRRCGRKTRGEG